MTVKMVDPVGQLLRELEWPKITQYSIALTYAWCIAQEPEGWAPKVNAAIRAKWPKGLNRIKKMAWKEMEEWPSRRAQATKEMTQHSDPL